MKTRKTPYPINQSPLYKISTHSKLANLLQINKKTLLGIVRRGDSNYFISETPPPKSRKLEIPKDQIRRVHKRINNLLSRIEAPDYLQSGVKKRSNTTNARAHIGEKSLAKLDIEKFYASTHRTLVKRCFRRVFKCPDDIAETLASLCCVEGHIPTGSPLSQSLGYFCNKSVFDHINIYSKSRDIKFTVYVDDLTFSGKCIPKHFLKYVSTHINKHSGYKCHKFRTYKSTSEKVVTGAVIIGNKLSVPRTQRRNINIHSKSLDSKLSTLNLDDPDLIKCFQVLTGHLFSAGQVNGRYYQRGMGVVALRKRLGIKALNQNTMKKPRKPKRNRVPQPV